MSGIAGFVNRDGQSADRAIIERMTGTLTHRGPDGEGFLLEGPFALGHRRLAIHDLDGAEQPWANEDASIWVAYDGEIYNEPDLRRALQGQGRRYRTQSAAETLIHLFEDRGPDFVRELNGMFALAIWESQRGRLTLARDRLGQKPLYYADLPGGGLAFASEPKALLAHPKIGRELDPDGLARYLFYEYLPTPYSIWQGVRKLPPAQTLIWEVGRVSLQSYWRSPLPSAEKIGFSEAADRFWDLWRGSVARQRRAEVPVGVFLSGGLDSSSVAAAICELEPTAEVRTFSIGFEDPSFDESPHARLVAQYLGTNHRERFFSVENVLDLLPEVAGWLDEPFGDASILPTHLLSRFAREEVRVVLGGDGADELLAGYPTFKAERFAGFFRRLPAPAQKTVSALAGRLPVDHRNFSLDFQIKQFLRGASKPSALAHQRWLGSFSGPELAALLVEPPTIDVEVEHLARADQIAPGADRLTRSLLLYQDTYLPEDILYKVDRAGMASGLEVRAPFLDAELVDFLAILPDHYKFGRGQTKRLLKRAVSRRLPPSIRKRPKKGFGIPLARWLRGPLGPMLNELLGPERLRRQGLFQPNVVARLIAEHREGVRDHRKPLWTLLMFQLWHDHWLMRGLD